MPGVLRKSQEAWSRARARARRKMMSSRWGHGGTSARPPEALQFTEEQLQVLREQRPYWGGEGRMREVGNGDLLGGYWNNPGGRCWWLSPEGSSGRGGEKAGGVDAS